jgi:hypothetical protein
MSSVVDAKILLPALLYSLIFILLLNASTEFFKNSYMITEFAFMY